MTMYVVKGTDSGAPSLTGVLGSSIAFFDYLLVTTMGWTKVYTGTNKAAYRAASGNRFYLRVDDSASLAYSRLTGYETMSDVDNGTGLFPTAAQLSGGLYMNKATTVSTGVVGTDWQFYSNGTLFYLFLNGGTAGAVTAARRPIIFGDYPSYKSGDAYNSILIADPNNTTQASIVSFQNRLCAADTTDLSGHYLTRAYTQLGSAVQCSKRSDTGGNFTGRLGGGSLTYPASIEGGMLLAPVWVSNGTDGLRGLLPGFWNPLHNRPLAHLDTFSGVGSLSGRTFEVIDLLHATGAAQSGQVFMETSDTWDTA